MRVLSVLVTVFFLGGVGTAQAPTPAVKPAAPAARPAAQAARPAAGPAFKAQPVGNLAQVMRGILFPNSNIIFDAQEKDPAAPPEKGVARSAYGDVYGGWQAVENASLALAEAAALITIPGRMCQNGKPAPVQRADWVKYAQGLVDAGKVAYKAAQSKNQDNIVDAAGILTDACAACHEVYRDKPTDAQRCQ